jgi:hypothetical protein
MRALSCGRQSFVVQIETSLSAYSVATRIVLSAHVAHGHSLSLELASSNISLFDIPSVLFVLACSKEQLFQLIDASAYAGKGGLDSERASCAQAHRATKHACRPSRLSCAADALNGGMHGLPDWCGPQGPEDCLSLLLQPVDSRGVCVSL